MKNHVNCNLLDAKDHEQNLLRDVAAYVKYWKVSSFRAIRKFNIKKSISIYIKMYAIK